MVANIHASEMTSQSWHAQHRSIDHLICSVQAASTVNIGVGACLVHEEQLASARHKAQQLAVWTPVCGCHTPCKLPYLCDVNASMLTQKQHIAGLPIWELSSHAATLHPLLDPQ